MRAMRRLGIITVERPSLKDRLESLSKRLTDGHASDKQMRDAAHYLRRLAQNEKALKAMESAPGRPHSADKRTDIALDYLVQKYLRGRGNAQAAKKEVATAWHTGLKNVESCFAEHGRRAQDYLDRIRDSHLVDHDDGIANHYTDENELLRAISADLRDIHSK